jgi:hypothetical protein
MNTPTDSAALPPMACSAYVVRGYALVPHEVEITVEAESPRQAMQKAKRIFERGPARHRFIVRGSEDLSAAFDFEPNEAKPPLGQNVKRVHPYQRRRTSITGLRL